MASGFNGFGCYEEIDLQDDVMASNFVPLSSSVEAQSAEDIKLIS